MNKKIIYVFAICFVFLFSFPLIAGISDYAEKDKHNIDLKDATNIVKINSENENGKVSPFIELSNTKGNYSMKLKYTGMDEGMFSEKNGKIKYSDGKKDMNVYKIEEPEDKIKKSIKSISSGSLSTSTNLRFLDMGSIDITSMSAYYELPQHFDNYEPTIFLYSPNEDGFMFYGTREAERDIKVEQTNLPIARTKTIDKEDGCPVVLMNDDGMFVITYYNKDIRNNADLYLNKFRESIEETLSQKDIEIRTTMNWIYYFDGIQPRFIGRISTDGEYIILAMYLNSPSGNNDLTGVLRSYIKGLTSIIPIKGLSNIDSSIDYSIGRAIVSTFSEKLNLELYLDSPTISESKIIQDLNVELSSDEWEQYSIRDGIKLKEETVEKLEVEIILNEKPDSNIFEYKIETQNLRFYYQPELTEEEKELGHYRGEYILGSYAVYNGDDKQFQIYRPEIIDASGDKVFGELFIDEDYGILRVTVPQEFLNNAVYPVIVDPTFGYTTIGSSSVAYTEGYIYGSKFSIIYPTATVHNLTGYFTPGKTANSFKMGIYDSDLNFVGGTTPTSGFETPAWRTYPITSGTGNLTEGDYYIVFTGLSAGGGQRLNYDTFDSDGIRSTSSYTVSSSFPASISTTILNNKHSLYGTYTPGDYLFLEQTYPIEGSFIGYESVSFNYTIDTNVVADKCWYNANGTNSTAIDAGTNFSIELDSSYNGLNNWTVYCNDTNGTEYSDNVSFTIDFNSSVYDEVSGLNVYNIDDCYVLSEENTSYNITLDLSANGTCFDIQANNITILGNNHTITYSISELGYGLYSNGYNNSAISNINTLQGSDINNAEGIYLSNSNHNSFDDVNPTANYLATTGFYLSDSSNNNFSNCYASVVGSLGGNIAYGFDVLSGSNNNTFSNINGVGSIASTILNINSDYNIIKNLEMSSNDSNGNNLALSSTADYNTLENNIISNTGTGYAIKSWGLTNNNFINNTITDNTIYTISLPANADNITFINNTINGKVYIRGTTDNLIFNNNNVSSSFTVLGQWDASRNTNFTISYNYIGGTSDIRYLNDATINNNTFVNPTYLEKVDNYYFDNNYFGSTGTWDTIPLYIRYATNINLNNSFVYSRGGYSPAVKIYSSQNIVIKNTFFDSIYSSILNLRLLTNGLIENFYVYGDITAGGTYASSDAVIVARDMVNVTLKNGTIERAIYPVEMYTTGEDMTFENVNFLDNEYTTLFSELDANRIFNSTSLPSFDVDVSYANLGDCTNFDYEITTYPNLTVDSVVNSNNLQFNFTPEKDGLYTIKLNVTTDDGSNEIRNYRILYGDYTEKVSDIYYMRETTPTHGQPEPLTGWDSGSLTLTPPTADEYRTCQMWVQFAPDEFYKDYQFIKDADIKWYSKASGTSAVSGVLDNQQFNVFQLGDNENVPMTSTLTEREVHHEDVNIALDYLENFYYTTLKFSGSSPYVASTVEIQSDVTFTYLNTGAEILFINESTGDLRNINVLSNVANDEWGTNYSLQFDGDGQINISLNMSGFNGELAILRYQGVDCMSNTNCTLNSKINDIYNFTLNISGVNNLNLYSIPNVTVGSPSSSSTGPISKTLSQSNIANGFASNYRNGDSIKFNVNSQSHTLKVNNLTSISVFVTVSSDPQTFEMTVGDVKNVDFENDGVYDLEVSYLKYFVTNIASIKVKEISMAYTLPVVEEKKDTLVDDIVDIFDGDKESEGSNLALILSILLVVIILAVIAGWASWYFVKRR